MLLLSFGQQFSTGALREFPKCTVSDYLVRGTDLFSLRLSNKKMATANTTVAIWCDQIKIIPIFLVRTAKNVFFGVLQNVSN